MLAMLHRRHRAKLPSRTFPVKILAICNNEEAHSDNLAPTARPSAPKPRHPFPPSSFPDPSSSPSPNLFQPRTSPPPTLSQPWSLSSSKQRSRAYLPLSLAYYTRAHLPLSLASARPIRRAFSGVRGPTYRFLWHQARPIRRARCSVAHQISSGGASFNRRLERRRWRGWRGDTSFGRARSAPVVDFSLSSNPDLLKHQAYIYPRSSGTVFCCHSEKPWNHTRSSPYSSNLRPRAPGPSGSNVVPAAYSPPFVSLHIISLPFSLFEIGLLLQQHLTSAAKSGRLLLRGPARLYYRRETPPP